MDEFTRKKILDSIIWCDKHEFKDIASRVNYLIGFLETDCKEVADLLEYCYSNSKPVLS